LFKEVVGLAFKANNGKFVSRLTSLEYQKYFDEFLPVSAKRKVPTAKDASVPKKPRIKESEVPSRKPTPTANSEKSEVSDTEEETVEEEDLEEKSIVCKETPSRRK
jgi:hypothetical protein